MQTLTVNLGDRSYPIHIGPGLLDRADLILPHLAQKRVFIVTNTTVGPLYLDRLSRTLADAGVRITSVVLPDGEAYKNLETLNLIFDALLTDRAERKTTLVALGGGVIGDITGFAAASYQRGVPFIQVPTTLLSQVDSSVGGKTGVNHPLGNNMIGAFWQPQLVLADTDSLNTLPDRELSAGMAEIIKYGLITDAGFFGWLEANIARLMTRDTAALTEAIYRSCDNKARVVAADEREAGLRALLNLGHTFGHAIEAGMGYGNWLHGEAVAAGTMLACDLSCRMGLFTRADCDRAAALFKAANLPTVAPALDAAEYLRHMGVDKKVEGGKLRFVLLRAIGEAFVSESPADLLQQTLTEAVA